MSSEGCCTDGVCCGIFHYTGGMKRYLKTRRLVQRVSLERVLGSAPTTPTIRCSRICKELISQMQSGLANQKCAFTGYRLVTAFSRVAYAECPWHPEV